MMTTFRPPALPSPDCIGTRRRQGRLRPSPPFQAAQSPQFPAFRAGCGSDAVQPLAILTPLMNTTTTTTTFDSPSAASVWVALSGGLGNQLFQWAAAQALSLDWGEPVPVLDLRLYDRTPLRRAFLAVRGAAFRLLAGRDGFFRYRMLDRQSELAGVGVTLAPLPGRRPAVADLRRAWRDPACGIVAGRRVVRDTVAVDRARPEPILIADWLQSERHFVHRAAEIRRFLEVPHASPAFDRWRDELSAPGAVAVHVRRGDLLKKCNRVFAVQSPAYYEQAARLVAERTGAERFFVFTDDPAWVRAEVRLPGTTVLVSGSEGASAVDDFRLMARAAHVVMANSTFSWWAAWLAERQGSCIVAPAAWDAAGGRRPELLPARWTVLDIPPLADR